MVCVIEWHFLVLMIETKNVCCVFLYNLFLAGDTGERGSGVYYSVYLPPRAIWRFVRCIIELYNIILTISKGFSFHKNIYYLWTTYPVAVLIKTSAKNHHVYYNIMIIIVKSMGIMNITIYYIYTSHVGLTDYLCTSEQREEFLIVFVRPFHCS